MNSNFIAYSPEEELASLPREYTIEHALSNNDIVYDLNMTYNTDGFYNFLVNVNHGIPDKVRITYCESERPAAISILHYDGNIIRLVTDWLPDCFSDEKRSGESTRRVHPGNG